MLFGKHMIIYHNLEYFVLTWNFYSYGFYTYNYYNYVISYILVIMRFVSMPIDLLSLFPNWMF